MGDEKPWLQRPSIHPKVLWESSIPDGWKRVLAGKSRPHTALKQTLSTHALLKRPVAKPQTVNTDARLFYSTKYLGITNGEIGILTQRKPIPHAQIVRPGKRWNKALSAVFSSDFSSSQNDSLASSTLQGDWNRDEDRSLAPDPKKYDDFVVTRYIKSRPLTPGKRDSATGKGAVFQKRPISAANYSSQSFLRPNFTPAKRERRGIAGWKLARTHSTTSVPRCTKSCSSKDADPSTPLDLQQLQALQKNADQFSETYIQYVLIKKSIEGKK